MTGFTDELVARTLERVSEPRIAAHRAARASLPPRSRCSRSLPAPGWRRPRSSASSRPAAGAAGPSARSAELAAATTTSLVVAADTEKAELALAYRRGRRREAPLRRGGARRHRVTSTFRRPRLSNAQRARARARPTPPDRRTPASTSSQCLQGGRRGGLRGAIVEFGAFKGGTTAWLARAAAHLGLEDCRSSASTAGPAFRRAGRCSTSTSTRVASSPISMPSAPTSSRSASSWSPATSRTPTATGRRAAAAGFFDTDNYSPARAALELCARPARGRWQHRVRPRCHRSATTSTRSASAWPPTRCSAPRASCTFTAPASSPSSPELLGQSLSGLEVDRARARSSRTIPPRCRCSCRHTSKPRRIVCSHSCAVRSRTSRCETSWLIVCSSEKSTCSTPSRNAVVAGVVEHERRDRLLDDVARPASSTSRTFGSLSRLTSKNDARRSATSPASPRRSGGTTSWKR